jgi:2-methylcitrate dehydratase PrpD
VIASATEALATFVAELDYDRLPLAVQTQAKLCLLDCLACALAGADRRTTRLARQYVDELGGRPQASFVGQAGRSSAEQAAFLNAISMRVLELDDTHPFSGMHPGSVVVAAALAAAEQAEASGRELLVALVAGYEVSLRVAQALMPAIARRGFHPTGACGVLGAAAAAGKLFGLDGEGLRLALGSAGTSAGGLFQFEPEGGESFMSNPLNAGRAASAGVASARLAQLGFQASRYILEGERGFAAAFGDDPNPRRPAERMATALGQPYLIQQLDFTPYASCRHARSAVEAALTLRSQLADGDDVRSFEVSTYSAAFSGSCQREQIATEFEALLSISYGVAASWLAGEMTPAQLDPPSLADERLRQLRMQVLVLPDESLDDGYPSANPTRLRLETARGRQLETLVTSYRGSHSNPFTDRDWHHKLHSLSAGNLTPTQADHLYSLTLDVDRQPTLAQLISLARPES